MALLARCCRPARYAADDGACGRYRGNVGPVSAPDQVLVSGVLASGAPVSIHYRGDSAGDGDSLFWEINGTEGDFRVFGPSGHTQKVQLSLKGVQDEEKAFRSLEVPASFSTGWPEDVAGNVARLYARMAHDLRPGTRTAPSFEDAVEVRRNVVAIESAVGGGSGYGKEPSSPGIEEFVNKKLILVPNEHS